MAAASSMFGIDWGAIPRFLQPNAPASPLPATNNAAFSPDVLQLSAAPGALPQAPAGAPWTPAPSANSYAAAQAPASPYPTAYAPQQPSIQQAPTADAAYQAALAQLAAQSQLYHAMPSADPGPLMAPYNPAYPPPAPQVPGLPAAPAAPPAPPPPPPPPVPPPPPPVPPQAPASPPPLPPAPAVAPITPAMPAPSVAPITPPPQVPNNNVADLQPVTPSAPAGPQTPIDPAQVNKLKTLSAAELKRLGATDKAAFFAALRPAAEAAEREYGVPAAVTLAQAALETGWGQHIIPGYNIFGIKGKGTAGSSSQATWEVYGGRHVNINANFAAYNNFYEGVEAHGKLFHNGYYDKAMNQYARDHDPYAFARNITGTYATDPSYGQKLSEIMRQYHLA